MVNLASKIEKFEEFFESKVLTFLAGIGNLRLRMLFRDLLLACALNPSFKKLDIPYVILEKLSKLCLLENNLYQDTLFYDDILSTLVEAEKNYSNLSLECKKLIISLCTSWCRDEELSIRVKSVDLILQFIEEIDSKEVCHFYRKKVLDNIVRFLRCHQGKEGQIKSAISILKSNIKVAQKF